MSISDAVLFGCHMLVMIWAYYYHANVQSKGDLSVLRFVAPPARVLDSGQIQ